MNSGYTHCACRDCFEIVVSDDEDNPDFCDECQEAGCEHDEECSREDQGWSDEEHEYHDYAVVRRWDIQRWESGDRTGERPSDPLGFDEWLKKHQEEQR